MQIAWKLDPVTTQKIKKSFLIGLVGFVVGTITILLQDKEVVAYLQAHPIVALAVGSFSPVIVNSLNEWRKGQPE